jgi:protein MpaA
VVKKKWTSRRAILAAGLAVLAAGAGCRERTTRMQTIGQSVQGRQIDARYFGQSGPVVLFIASIHGDEPAGTPLLRKLQEEFAARPKLLAGRQVVMIEVANPDGLAANTRENARGVDLNRNFPADNFNARGNHGDEPGCEPESAALRRFIDELRPDRVVTIHQPLRCVDWDGPAEELARVMAEHSGMRLKRLGARPGSMGSYVGQELGIPIITLELPTKATKQTAEELWARYGKCLIAAVRWPEAVK